MIKRFVLATVAAAGLYCATVPASAEDVGVGAGPVGVTIGDHDRDRDRDHKTVIIKKDRDDGSREKTIIKKDRDDD